jgi:salicylate hydroxylase
MGIEDGAVMAELLAEAQRRVQSSHEGAVTTATALEAAFLTFDACRRERTQWWVQNSRVCGEVFQWRHPSSGRDAERCKEELERRAQQIWSSDVEGMVKDAVKELGETLQGRGEAGMTVRQ